VAAMEQGNERARLAFDLFVRRVAAGIASMAVSLGGLDALVFTGGIGERAAQVRAEVCQGLEHLGIELDDGANASSAAIISRSNGRCMVRVVETDEDLIIARHTRTVLLTAKIL